MAKKIDEVQSIAISKLRESPTNPRRTFGDLGELVKSIRRQGILQPLLARPTDDGLELVFGHRRFRAAKAAGFKDVPVIVREMSSDEALEAQLVENLQREDIHPLEEAEGFNRLRAEFGHNADTIAERLGRSRASVFASLKLLDLSPPARKAFYAGRLTSSTALLVAGYDSEAMQVRAVDLISEKGGEPLSFREASRVLNAKLPRKQKPSAKPSRKDVADEGSDDLRDTLLARAVGTIEKARTLGTPELRLMVVALLESPGAWSVLKRRSLDGDAALSAVQRRLSDGQLRALLFELACAPWLASDNDGSKFRVLCRALGVTQRELEAEQKSAKQQDEADALFSRPKSRAQ